MIGKLFNKFSRLFKKRYLRTRTRRKEGLCGGVSRSFETLEDRHMLAVFVPPIIVAPQFPGGSSIESLVVVSTLLRDSNLEELQVRPSLDYDDIVLPDMEVPSDELPLPDRITTVNDSLAEVQVAYASIETSLEAAREDADILESHIDIIDQFGIQYETMLRDSVTNPALRAAPFMLMPVWNKLQPLRETFIVDAAFVAAEIEVIETDLLTVENWINDQESQLTTLYAALYNQPLDIIVEDVSIHDTFGSTTTLVDKGWRTVDGYRLPSQWSGHLSNTSRTEDAAAERDVPFADELHFQIGINSPHNYASSYTLALGDNHQLAISIRASGDFRSNRFIVSIDGQSVVDRAMGNVYGGPMALAVTIQRNGTLQGSLTGIAGDSITFAWTAPDEQERVSGETFRFTMGHERYNKDVPSNPNDWHGYHNLRLDYSQTIEIPRLSHYHNPLADIEESHPYVTSSDLIATPKRGTLRPELENLWINLAFEDIRLLELENNPEGLQDYNADVYMAALVDIASNINTLNLELPIDPDTHSGEAMRKAANDLNSKLQGLSHDVERVIALRLPNFADLQADFSKFQDGNAPQDTAILPLGDAGGAVVAQTWNGRLRPGGDSSLHISQAELLSLDLANAVGKTESISFRLDRYIPDPPEEGVTFPSVVTGSARFYSGTDLLGQLSITSDELVNFDAPSGITAVLITPSVEWLEEDGLQLYDISTHADLHDATMPSEALSPMNNRELALVLSQDAWFDYPALTSEQDTFVNQRYNLFRTRRVDGELVGMTGSKGYITGNQSNEYTRLSAQTEGSGTVTIHGVRVMVNGSPDVTFIDVPSQFYEIQGQDIILAPGLPSSVIVDMTTNVETFLNPIESGPTKESVLPSTELQVKARVTFLLENDGNSGVFDGNFVYNRQYYRPLIESGKNYHSVTHLTNNSSVGTTVSVHFYVDGVYQETTAVALSPYAYKHMIHNFTALQYRGGVTVVVEKPDGSQVIDGAISRLYPRHEPSTKKVYYPEAKPGEPQFITVATNPSLKAHNSYIRNLDRAIKAHDSRVESGRLYSFDLPVQDTSNPTGTTNTWESAVAAVFEHELARDNILYAMSLGMDPDDVHERLGTDEDEIPDDATLLSDAEQGEVLVGFRSHMAAPRLNLEEYTESFNRVWLGQNGLVAGIIEYLEERIGSPPIIWSSDDPLVFGEQLNEQLSAIADSPENSQFMSWLSLSQIRQFVDDALSWSEGLQTPATLDRQILNTSTAIGKIAHGLSVGLWAASQDGYWRGETFESLAYKASLTTGLPSKAFRDLPFDSRTTFERRLNSLLEQPGYEINVSEVATSGITVFENGDTRVNFDVPVDSIPERYKVRLVYLDHQTELPDTHVLTGFYTDIKRSELGDTGSDVKVQIVDEVGNVLASTEFFEVPAPREVQLDVDLGGLSDHSGTPLVLTDYNVGEVLQRYKDMVIADNSAQGVTLTQEEIDAIPLPNHGLVSPALREPVLNPDGSITLSWDDISGETRYKIYIFSSENTGGKHLFAPGNTTQATVQGFVPGNTYFFALRAEDENGRLYNSEYQQGGYDGLIPFFIDDPNVDGEIDWSRQSTGQIALGNYFSSIDPSKEVTNTVVPRFIKTGQTITESMSSHSSGKAVDIFFRAAADPQAINHQEELEKGNNLFNRLIEKADTLGITEILWQDQYWSPEDGITPYPGHENHIHVTLSSVGAMNNDFSVLDLSGIL